MDSLGLYLHIPYCLHKCGYCDFNSHKVDTQEMQPYKAALLRELAHFAGQLAENRTVDTIFLGGGTPTTFPVPYLQEIMTDCRRYFNVAPDCEITLEANPATIEPDTLKKLRDAGYNRISIGVQSFDADELKLLERVHDVAEIHSTVDRARDGGFDNLSMDLMFALPGQTLSRWDDSLGKALGKNPEHISTYNLTIESGTAFHKLQDRGKLSMPPDDFQLELYQHSIRKITESGYNHYEISNFCRPGKECRHNLAYWENKEVLGLGAGASSYVNGVRFKNSALPSRYIREVQNSGTAVESEEKLDPRRAMGETLMLGLRMLRGIDIEQFDKRFQTSFHTVYENVLSRLGDQDLITTDKNRIALSEKGLFLADSVILEFIA